MNQTQLRTIRLDSGRPEARLESTSCDGDALIVSIGALRRVSAGRSIRETLHEVGIPLPTLTQTLRVNADDEVDLGRTVQPGDKLTIVNRVVGG